MDFVRGVGEGSNDISPLTPPMTGTLQTPTGHDPAGAGAGMWTCSSPLGRRLQAPRLIVRFLGRHPVRSAKRITWRYGLALRALRLGCEPKKLAPEHNERPHFRDLSPPERPVLGT
jgi:hypothetical protein